MSQERSREKVGNQAPDVVGQVETITLSSERVIAYRPEIAKYFNDSVDVALYFQQLNHWQQFAKSKDGFFYKSAKEIYEETSISAMKQRKCREKLEQAGWITIEKRMANGVPTLHFRVSITLSTVVSPFVKITNPLYQNNKSITQEDNTIKNITSDLTKKHKDEIDKIYKLWLIYTDIDIEIRNRADAYTRKRALEESMKRYRLTPGRALKIGRRLDDAGYAMLSQAIKNISQSSFHMGGGESGWKADLADFLCRSYETVEKWANASNDDKRRII